MPTATSISSSGVSRPSSPVTQCAAVSTQSERTIVPPQNWACTASGCARLSSATMKGHSAWFASAPPAIAGARWGAAPIAATATSSRDRVTARRRAHMERGRVCMGLLGNVGHGHAAGGTLAAGRPSAHRPSASPRASLRCPLTASPWPPAGLR